MSKNKELRKYPLSQSRIINVNGKRYRSFSMEDQTQKRSEEKASLEPALKKQKGEDDDSSGSGTVVTRVPFFIGNRNMGKIIGRQGSTKSRLERDTNCKLIVPPRHVFSHYIEIEGFNEDSIEKCKSKIRDVIPKETQVTHFLSIKIGKCRAILEKFQNQILQEFGNDVHRQMFISPYKLHLTLQVISITSLEMLEKVKQVMNTRIQPFIDEEFKGDKNECYVKYFSLGTFPERNARNAKVLHFQPTHTESIARLIKHINLVFVEEKILESEAEVTLHSTIMNIKYFKRGGGGGRSMNNNKIDAREILKKYGDLKGTGFEGKKLPFKTLQLNILGPGDPNKADKYYQADHTLFFHK